MKEVAMFARRTAMVSGVLCVLSARGYSVLSDMVTTVSARAEFPLLEQIPSTMSNSVTVPGLADLPPVVVIAFAVSSVLVIIYGIITRAFPRSGQDKSNMWAICVLLYLVCGVPLWILAEEKASLALAILFPPVVFAVLVRCLPSLPRKSRGGSSLPERWQQVIDAAKESGAAPPQLLRDIFEVGKRKRKIVETQLILKMRKKHYAQNDVEHAIRYLDDRRLLDRVLDYKKGVVVKFGGS